MAVTIMQGPALYLPYLRNMYQCFTARTASTYLLRSAISQPVP